MKTLLLLLLFLCSCAATPKHVNVLYIQYDCNNRMTHSYWYSGKLFKSFLPYDKGFISCDQKDIQDYIAMDTGIADIPKGADLPFGLYSVYIGGYCLKAESMKDCVVIYPNRISELK